MSAGIKISPTCPAIHSPITSSRYSRLASSRKRCGLDFCRPVCRHSRRRKSVAQCRWSALSEISHLSRVYFSQTEDHGGAQGDARCAGWNCGHHGWSWPLQCRHVTSQICSPSIQNQPDPTMHTEASPEGGENVHEAGEIMTDSGRMKFLEERLARKPKRQRRRPSLKAIWCLFLESIAAKKPKTSGDVLWFFFVDGFGSCFILVNLLFVHFHPCPCLVYPRSCSLSHLPFCTAWKRGLIPGKTLGISVCDRHGGITISLAVNKFG